GATKVRGLYHGVRGLVTPAHPVQGDLPLKHGASRGVDRARVASAAPARLLPARGCVAATAAVPCVVGPETQLLNDFRAVVRDDLANGHQLTLAGLTTEQPLRGIPGQDVLRATGAVLNDMRPRPEQAPCVIQGRTHL